MYHHVLYFVVNWYVSSSFWYVVLSKSGNPGWRVFGYVHITVHGDPPFSQYIGFPYKHCIRSIAFSWIAFGIGNQVARFFLVQFTKMLKNIPNLEEISKNW
jgi:hypothetical protein